MRCFKPYNKISNAHRQLLTSTRIFYFLMFKTSQIACAIIHQTSNGRANVRFSLTELKKFQHYLQCANIFSMPDSHSKLSNTILKVSFSVITLNHKITSCSFSFCFIHNKLLAGGFVQKKKEDNKNVI